MTTLARDATKRATGTFRTWLDELQSSGRLGAKLGFDCTVPFDGDAFLYLRVRIPGERSSTAARSRATSR